MTGARDSAEGPGLIFLEPVFEAKVWGGTRLRDLYGYALPDEKIGECWAISARPEGDCVVRNGPFLGSTLSALWSEHRELFGGLGGNTFPLQIKILDACDDLSVQVHPTAEYAALHEKSGGKNECWYVMGASATGRIVIGHTAQTREDFARLTAEQRWDELLRRIEMKEGDFFFIPAGTVHAILAGSLIYEVQQSSNVTYRLYDYDRLSDGVGRELHVRKALDVVTVPSRPGAIEPTVTAHKGATERLYTRNEYFSVSKWEVPGAASIAVDAPFLLVSVLEGSGTVDGSDVTAGDHFVVPAGVESLHVTGPVTLMVTTP